MNIVIVSDIQLVKQNKNKTKQHWERFSIKPN